MKFWDASAIIPLCIDEPQTKILQDIAKKDNAIVVWWGSLVECYSAFARLRRDGALKFEEEEQLRGILASLSDTWTEIEPSEDIRDITGRLLLNHPLRAADSLQLAAAIVWADKKPRGHHFVCLDFRLREAARKEGFSALPAKVR
ncbi:MAG: type II toxin-antitoxin system VapC family toxin [Nitrospirota bacterium]|nr:type II toxin-antitoxin system VapC family toxin [Nitrospirota bacterium]